MKHICICILGLVFSIPLVRAQNPYSMEKTITPYQSPYNVDEMERYAREKHQLYNYNHSLVMDEVDSFLDDVDEVEYKLGGFTKEQNKILDNYINDLNRALKAALSNTAYVRALITNIRQSSKTIRNWARK